MRTVVLTYMLQLLMTDFVYY